MTTERREKLSQCKKEKTQNFKWTFKIFHEVPKIHFF